MKKFTLLFCVLAIAFSALAQELTITFQPVVGGDAIDSIIVINQTTLDTTKLNPDESLLLSQTTGIDINLSNAGKGYLYPNPFSEKTTLCFNSKKSDEVTLSIYNVSGSAIAQQKRSLAAGNHRFNLSFPSTGLYFVSVLKDGQVSSYKAIYKGNVNRDAAITYEGNEALTNQRQSNQLKSAVANKSLGFSEGDILHYICYSGGNSTVIGDSPTASKTVDVEIFACEIEGQKYRTVKIGEQIWMAENFAYLPQVNAQDDLSTTEARYYVYNHTSTDVDEAKESPYYAEYGALYNYVAALDNSPRGWRLPSNDDWEQLKQFISDDQGTTVDLAEYLKTTTGWIEEGWGSGTDNYGFSANPAGRLNSDGSFSTAAGYGWWWSSTEVSATEGHKYWTKQSTGDWKDSDASKSIGYSVRYLMN